MANLIPRKLLQVFIPDYQYIQLVNHQLFLI